MSRSIQVVLLGTGGPRPDPLRNGRVVVVHLARAGIPLTQVNPVVVTHRHEDRIGADLAAIDVA